MTSNKREERAIRNVLTTNFHELCTRIAAANPLTFGGKLVAKLIVTSVQFQAIQHKENLSFASQLVTSAKPLLELEHNKFESFLGVLLENVACHQIGRKMCNDMVQGKS